MTKQLCGIAAVTCALAFTACGSEDDGSSSGASAASSTSSDAGASAVEKAKKVVADASAYPTSIGVDTPLPKAPERGKTIAFVTCPLPLCGRITTGMKAVAGSLGWTIKPYVTDLENPTSDDTTLTSAVAAKPDAIVLTGSTPRVFPNGMKAARAAKIPVFLGNVDYDFKGEADGIYGNPASASVELGGYANLIANFIVADSNAKAKVVATYVPEFEETSAPWPASLKKVLSERCPQTCELDTLDVSVNDLFKGKATQNIISYLQRNPDVNYIAYLNGDMSQGITSALKQAGLDETIKVVGETATKENIQQLLDKKQHAWTGQGLEIEGARLIDLIARHFGGASLEELKKVNDIPLPVNIMTQESVKGPAADYQFPKDYAQQFAKLWGVG